MFLIISVLTLIIDFFAEISTLNVHFPQFSRFLKDSTTFVYELGALNQDILVKTLNQRLPRP